MPSGGNSLDIVAVCEMRVRHNTPDAISMDIAPPGYRIIHAPAADDHDGGGQAVIFHQNLNIASVPLPFVPSRFDAQIVV